MSQLPGLYQYRQVKGVINVKINLENINDTAVHYRWITIYIAIQRANKDETIITDGRRAAENIFHIGVAGYQFRRLTPVAGSTPVPLKNVSHPGMPERVTQTSSLARSANDGRITVNGDSISKQVTGLGIFGF